MDLPVVPRRSLDALLSGMWERALRARDLTLRGLAEQVFEAFTNVDGRLLRTFRGLVGRPGF